MSGMEEQVTVPKETAQILFDALVHNMDFGSGFLDTDEVKAMRGLAVAIGVDPLKATPEGFVKYYPHPFQAMTDSIKIDKAFGIQRVVAVEGPNGWTTERNNEQAPYVPCEAGWPWCTKPEIDPIRQAKE